MNYIIGKKYSFKVVRSRRTLSIVSDGSNSYEYYGELLEGAEVDLYIKNIVNNKIYFNSNPFEFEEEKLIMSQLLTAKASRASPL